MNYIGLRKNNLCVENVSALSLAKKYKTPFYCYSLSQLKNNYWEFYYAFRKVKPLICFSVKSNSNLTLLKELKKIGSGADIVFNKIYVFANEDDHHQLICTYNIPQNQDNFIEGIDTIALHSKYHR